MISEDVDPKELDPENDFSFEPDYFPFADDEKNAELIEEQLILDTDDEE